MTRSPLRPTVGLVGAHLVLSLAVVAVLVARRHDKAVATSGAWVHGIIVLATAVVLLAFSFGAMRGSLPAYRRLRISSAVLFVALVVVVAIPGAFPDWMRVLEAGSAACLGVVVALVNARGSRFAVRRDQPCG